MRECLQKIYRSSRLRPATLLKKRLWHRSFPVNFAEFLSVTFLKEHLWWLFLDQFIKEHFGKETCMCVVNEQDCQFPTSHWVMVYQYKKKTYFIDSFGKDFTHYDFKFKRPVHQISRRFQCLGSKLCGAYLVFFGCRLVRRLDMKQHYGLLYMGLQIQQRVHLRLHQGKTLNSKRQYEKIQKYRPIYQKR